MYRDKLKLQKFKKKRGGNYSNLVFDKYFLKRTQNTQNIYKNNLDFIKCKMFGLQNIHSQKERKTMIWNTIDKTHI